MVLESEDAPYPPENVDLEKLGRLAGEVQTRVDTLAEVPAMVDFLFLDEPVFDEKSWTKHMTTEHARSVLSAALDVYGACPWKTDDLHAETKALGEGLGLGLTKTQFPIRVAVTGREQGPPLFQSLEVMGRSTALDRIRAALARMG